MSYSRSNSNCGVAGCGNYTSMPGLSFHYFPRRGMQKIQKIDRQGNVKFVDVRDEWERVLKMDKPVSEFRRICAEHFRNVDYIPSYEGKDVKRKTLKKNAVPTLKLPTMSPKEFLKLKKTLSNKIEKVQIVPSYVVTNEHDYGLPTGATNEKNKTLEELTNRDPLSLNETITREEEFMNAIDEINAHQKRNFAQNSWQDSTETKQDEMDVFAAGVAAKLRRLNDENLKILVQRDIDMLLYDALIGTGRYSNVARRNGNNSNLNSEMSSFSDGNIHSQVKIENDDYFETDNN